MVEYRNTNGDSNVRQYEIGNDFIRVMFADGRIYTYTNTSAGIENIQQMKILAGSGRGLNSFINKYVRFKYSK